MPYRPFFAIAAMSSLLLAAGCRELDRVVSPLTVGETPAGIIQSIDVTDDAWTLVKSTLILPGTRAAVTGSRYTLTFQPLSLVTSLLVTIRERDFGIVDVELGPDGSLFLQPVTLEIDYHGTEFDRSLPSYSGRQARLFWFDPNSKSWVLVPGTDDPKRCVYTVKLQHFSRYAMSEGTSGWENANDRDKDAIN